MPTPAILDSGADSVDATSKTTALITTSASRLAVAVIHNRRGTTAPTLPTVIDANRTWVQIATALSHTIATPLARVTFFRCMVGATGAATFDFGGVTQEGFVYYIVEWDGVDTGGSNGANAVVQSVTGNANAVTSLLLTLAALGSANNAVFGSMGRQSSVNDVVAGSGFIQLSTLGISSPNARTQIQWALNDTTVDWSWGAAQNAGGIAIEIKAATTPPAVEGPGTARTPWVEISRRVAASSYAVETTRHAAVDYAINDPASYYGGRKPGDVLSFGSVFRELSDESGQLRESTLSVSLQDTDRAWRTRIAADVFKGQPLTIRTISDTSRRAGGTPKIIARQQLYTPTPNADGSVTFSGRDRIAALLSGESTDLLVPQIQITDAHFLEIASDDEFLNLGIPEIYGSHLNTALGFGGPIPVLPIDFPYSIDSFDYGLGLVCVGACQSMPELRVNNEIVPTNDPFFLRPGSTSWNSKTDLLVGGNPVTYYTLPSGLRITCVFISWEVWSDVKDGRRKVTCTLHGVEDSVEGNGTGSVITSGPRQLLHWLNNRVFRSQWTEPYATPVDLDGIPYVDEQSFFDAEAVQIARLGGGYPLRWCVGPERVRPDEQLASIVRSMGGRIGQNWPGSLLLRMFDRGQSSSMSIATQGTPAIILKGSLEPEIDDASHANQINYECGELYSQSGMECSGASVRDEVSATKYGRVYDSDVLSLAAVGDIAVAYDIAYHELKARTEPPYRYRQRASIAALDVELGRTVLLTHPLGIGGSGVTAAPMWVEGIGHDIRSGDVPMTLFDQNRVASSLVITSSVTSITRVGNLATVTQTAHGYTSGRAITIAGANEAPYNGTKIITVTGVNTYTFGVGDPATPATGTITASTRDLGRLLIAVKDVKVQDKQTETGPIVQSEYDLGSALAFAPAANVYTNLTNPRPARFDKAAVGKRKVVAKVWIKLLGGGTDVTPRITTEGGTTIATGDLSSSTSLTLVEFVLQDFHADPIVDELLSGENSYKGMAKRNNATNAFDIWMQINVL